MEHAEGSTPSRERRALHVVDSESSRQQLIGAPQSLSLLVGREAELGAVQALLAAPGCRLLTLTGPGGTGKTRLALAVAAEAIDDFPDGVVYVPLEALRDPADVLPAIARTLGLRPPPEQTLGQNLLTVLTDRTTLLVLDNLEHLPDASSDLTLLLETCPGVRLLVTSRVALRLSYEHRYQTPPLALPPEHGVALAETAEHDAIALFVERGRQVRATFTLTPANVDDVVAICRRLDGLPLAIELAASWLQVLTPAALQQRLDHTLPLLTGGGVDQPPRLRDMRDAIGWSYDLLDAADQRRFRWLGVFVGGFPLAGAARLWQCGAETIASDATAPPEWAVIAQLSVLLESSLVQTAGEEDGELRFRLLETVREYALEQLTRHDELADATAAHAQWVRAAIATVAPDIIGPDEHAVHRRILRELGNVRAAMSWGLTYAPALTLMIVTDLWLFWMLQALPMEGIAALTSALNDTKYEGEAVPASVRAMGLNTAVALMTVVGITDPADSHSKQALQLATELGEPLTLARAWFVRGCFEGGNGDFDRAADSLAQAETFWGGASTSTEQGFRAYNLSSLALFRVVSGRSAEAVPVAERAFALVQQHGSDFLAILVAYNLATCLHAVGEFDQARVAVQAGLRSMLVLANSGRVEQLWPISHGLIQMARLDLERRDPAELALIIGAAEGVSAFSGTIVPVPIQVGRDEVIAQVEHQLGAEQVDTLRQAGRRQPEPIIARILAELEPGAANRSSRGAIDPRLSSLTTREREVLSRVMVGESDRVIAAALFISPRTASNHVTRILAKLGVSNRAGAVALVEREARRPASQTL